MSDQTDDNTIVLDLGNNMYGAGTSYISGGAGSDTITIGATGSSFTYDSYGAVPSMAYTTIIPNGGNYTLSSGTSSTISNWSSYNYDPNVNITSDGITMKPGTDITVGGKSLTEAIAKIEERLNILHPNPALEDRWEQLKALRQQYIDLEKDLLEKEKLMKILKEK